MLGVRKLVTATAAVLAIAVGAAVPHAVNAQEKTAFSYPIQKTEDRVAIDGYDLVAYFKKKEAMKGNPEHAVEYGDTIYYFASRSHQNAFLKHPTKYLPRFGGFCPVNLGDGKAVEGNPKEFTIRDGQLYLCASGEAKQAFEGEPKKIVHKAEQNAPEVLRARGQRGR